VAPRGRERGAVLGLQKGHKVNLAHLSLHWDPESDCAASGGFRPLRCTFRLAWQSPWPATVSGRSCYTVTLLIGDLCVRCGRDEQHGTGATASVIMDK
jgi:hypothetical protein